MEAIEVQLARLDERFKGFEKLPDQINESLQKMEQKLDRLTASFSSEYVRKDELDRILAERKSSLISWQNVVWAVVTIILSTVLSAGVL